ncbi:TPM domain-containing protein [Oryzomicrobium sp.]|uniref:TPM domain-containing protein n=1 Tax=Oryzomicrobium sp. TaxID=1911578 RepID=UPI0025EBBA9F|nr:TPM domain-containing protein [Oryzomicrobium sp.]MCE1242665.1 TPM domain-containing protein [Oryzomicrobium sp.]
MTVTRVFKHLLVPGWWGRRHFPSGSLARIEAAIADSEARHGGELRFVVETALPLAYLRRGEAGIRERALDLFSHLRVWDTEGNTGILVYVLLADRRVEIVADRGIHARVGEAAWTKLCRQMGEAFRAGNFEAGTLAALADITVLLEAHVPPPPGNPNELPDRPLVLG